MAKMVTINLDKERHLKYNLNSFIEFTKLTGKEMLAKDREAKLTFEDMRAMVYVGLIHEDKELTVEAVGEMIDLDNMEAVGEKLGEALGDLKQ